MPSENYRLRRQKEDSTPWLAIVLIALLVLVMFGLLTLGWLKGSLSNTRFASNAPTQVSEQVGPGQDTVFTVDNVSVVVPRDATAMAGSLSITPREPNLFAFAGAAEWTRPLVVSVDYYDGNDVIQPGMKFSRPILICFKLTPEQWADYTARPNEYAVQYYAEGKSPPVWENLITTAYPENNFLCGQTDHLSTFALAVRLAALVPITGITLTPTPSVPANVLTPLIQPTVLNTPRPPQPTQPEPSPIPPTTESTSAPTEIPTEPPTEPPTEEPPNDHPGRPTRKPRP